MYTSYVYMSCNTPSVGLYTCDRETTKKCWKDQIVGSRVFGSNLKDTDTFLSRLQTTPQIDCWTWGWELEAVGIYYHPSLYFVRREGTWKELAHIWLGRSAGDFIGELAEYVVLRTHPHVHMARPHRIGSRLAQVWTLNGFRVEDSYLRLNHLFM